MASPRKRPKKKPQPKPYRPKKYFRQVMPGNSGGGSVTETALVAAIISDTHVESENLDLGDPNVRQVAALNNMPGRVHPQGGSIGAISLLLVLGDDKHEDYGTVDRFASYYMESGPAAVRAPAKRVVRGNHDNNDMAARIIQEYGSLTWGYKLGPIYFQALTENFVSEPNNSSPPSVAQIAEVDALLAARPADEPKIICVHRALTGTDLPPPNTTGYLAEWDWDALAALETMCNERGVVGILYGHNHYSDHFTWRGIKCFSPGSVRQFPEDAPYSTTYPENFLIMRITNDWYDVAAYRFGYDVNRVFSPNVWEWSERVYF